ncbi:FAD-binding monooxygenase ausC [Colletotrichum siamense]|uniref:FAD-binding monooxygenase ausC n=1 Tax=Colletotrichum siamense TaxID=690259 RepID=A0A9P5EXL3_COLSI|nr:FAD-binding monooxygenase ausC [Colletotrichum siamense]KAF4861263.1 FAD-binding monooxygenase ausC [Colletotrichum siamense]
MEIPDHLVEKYAAERTKRLRSDQLAQFVDFRDPELAKMDKDPYVDYDALASRGAPLKDGSEVKVLIAGGGMFGVMTAHQLVHKAGIASSDIVIVDKAGGFGGTWYWNRYPGVACDIEGYCYVPLLEETGSYGHEIREHLERIASLSNIQGQFCTTIKHQKWDDEAKRWVVTLDQYLGPNHGRQQLTVRAQFLVLGGGVQTSPHAPKLNGIDAFSSAPGKVVMHTGRWDWSKTGGSQEAPDMTKLQGKRVGIIGTGATAVQVAPHVAKWADHTYIFQRTPSYVGPQNQKETTPTDWARVAYKPGWQHERVANLDATFTGQPVDEDMIQDGWTQVTGMRAALGHEGEVIAADEEEEHVKKMLNLDYPWTEKMRARVDAEVKDPSVAESLKAWYPGFCKRPTFHGTYLSLFNRPEVSLVDTNGRGVEAYTPNGVMANGQEHELDVLILATGYSVGLVDSCPSSALNAPLEGRGGRLFKDKWDGPDYGNLYGAMSNGYPNLFFASGSGGSVSQNAHSFYSLLARLIAHVLKATIEGAEDVKKATVEVEKATEDHWSTEVARRARWFAAFPSCTPGYLTGEGLVQDQDGLTQEIKEQIAKQSSWGEGILSFQKIVEAWMKAEKLDGVAIH